MALVKAPEPDLELQLLLVMRVEDKDSNSCNKDLSGSSKFAEFVADKVKLSETLAQHALEKEQPKEMLPRL